MRHLSKVKNSLTGEHGVVIPNTIGIGAKAVSTIQSNVYVHKDDFIGDAQSVGGVYDADEWAPGTSLGTGGASIAYASSMVAMQSGTGTAGMAILAFRGAQSAGANVYNVPFRMTFEARFSVTASTGVAPTGGLSAYMGFRSTDELHVGQFRLDFSTAGSSSFASPVINMETRQGSTGAAFINSAAVNIFNSALSRTATAVVGYIVEVDHRGVSFGIREDRTSIESGEQMLQYFPLATPRIDLNYIPYFALIADGTAGYSQTAGLFMEVDAVTVEQFSWQARPALLGSQRMAEQGSVHSFYAYQPLASNAAALATTGAGIFLGYGFASSATVGYDLFVAAYDASANGTAVYDFTNNASGAARLLWHAQVQSQNSAAVEAGGMSSPFPSGGIPFYRGLVIGLSAATPTAVATAIGSAGTLTAVLKSI